MFKIKLFKKKFAVVKNAKKLIVSLTVKKKNDNEYYLIKTL